ncbi:MAG: hypothetical protein SF053_03005 [Bacteroidia bacterium]|nr:hypothetical protein [Bacteroidia bacterium]
MSATTAQQLRDMAARGETGPAIQQLLLLTEGHTDLHNDVVMLSGRYHRNEREKNAGLLDAASVNIEQNKITAALLHLIGRLPASSSPAGISPTIIQQADKIYNIGKIDEANFS